MDRFEETMHRIGAWCDDHKIATVGSIALVLGLLVGIMLAS